MIDAGTRYCVLWPDGPTWEMTFADGAEQAEDFATFAASIYGVARVILLKMGASEWVVDFTRDDPERPLSMWPPRITRDLGETMAWRRVHEVLEACFAERRKARVA